MWKKERGWPFLLAAFTVAAWTAGCTDRPRGPDPSQPETAGSKTPGASSAPSAPGGEYEVAEVKDPGVLGVSVKFAGDPVPAREPITVNVNVDVCGHEEKLFKEDLVVDTETRALANVVVRLLNVPRGKAPEEVITVTNKNCAFVPHVSVTMKGQRLQITNDDPVLHTTHPWHGARSLFNVSLRAGGPKKNPRKLRQAGLVRLACDVHKWMNGWIVVHDNPYAAVSGTDGKLTIDEIPPGKYTYVAWHETLGEQRGEVEIKANAVTELALEFAPGK